MLAHFEKLRSESRFVDCTVRSSTTSLKLSAHAVLLAAGTKHFAEQLASDDVIKTEASQYDVCREIKIEDISDSILQIMITYLYTARASMTSHTVKALMDAAQVLQTREVVEGCSEYLEGTITVNNSIDLQKTAEKYECDNLKVIYCI